jgi:hypothetical protein
MKKIILGGSFVLAGYFLIKYFMKPSKTKVEKPKLEFIPDKEELTIQLKDGTEKTIPIDLKGLELLHEKAKDIRDNPQGFNFKLYADDFSKGDVEALKNDPILKSLQGINPAKIDTTAIENLGKLGNINLGFPTAEELKLAIDKMKTGTPILPK